MLNKDKLKQLHLSVIIVPMKMKKNKIIVHLINLVLLRLMVVKKAFKLIFHLLKKNQEVYMDKENLKKLNIISFKFNKIK